MTRFLSHALSAPEPFFRHGLRQLEQANGNPSTDIRFSTEVMQAAKAKLTDLNLDPADTTPKELYGALKARVKDDDKLLTRYLQTHAATYISAEADVAAGMASVIRRLPEPEQCYGIKSGSFKNLIKANPPKKAIKKLGYRSVDSCLKQEVPAAILTAAWIIEGDAWHKKLTDQYKKLQPTDFENRTIQVLQPVSAKWQQLANSVAVQRNHNVLCLKELGALVFMPLPAGRPDGAVTVSFSQALHELNEIRAASTYLRMSQFKSDFGQAVQTVARDEPRLSSALLDQPVPWHLIQQYYSRLNHKFREDVFEPYLQLEDMVWQPVERTLAAMLPNFGFWQQTAHLGTLDGHRPVSYNLLDVAISHCNQLPYERRLSHYFQRSLWHELMLRYMHHGPVEQAILSELQPQLATEPVRA